MFFEEETKDTHGNMDDYDLDIEQGESVSWDKLLDDKEELDEPADLETKENSDDEDIADKLLNMDDDSFDAFVLKQQQSITESPNSSSEADNEVDFDEFLLDDIDEETEDALKKAVKSDLSSDNNYVPEVIQEEDFDDEEDILDFIQDEEEVQQEPQETSYVEQQESQNIQQEIAQINDLDEEEEVSPQFAQAQENKYDVETAEAFIEEEEEDSFNQEQFAETTPDIPALAGNPQEAAGAAGGNFSQKANAPKKQNSSMTVALLAVLLLAAGGYFAYTNYGDKLGIGGTGSDMALDMSQDSSLNTTPDTGAVVQPPGDALDASAPPANTADIPAPPIDETTVQSAPQAQANAGAKTGAEATKSVSKAIEQGRTKIAKDKDADKTKANIQIVTTGRLNPFVPVGNLNNIGFITSPKIDILPPNETLGQPDPLLDKLMSIKVSGILYDGVNSSAVINLDGVDYFVQKGDRIDSFTVVDITKTTVAIKEKNNIFSATIGQTFSANQAIQGQTQIQKQNNTVIRQYTTTQDININTSNQ